MTVQTLLRVTTCPIELRSGRRSIFAKISDTNVRNHLNEEVWMIRARGSVLEVFSNVPDYELDRDVDVDQTEDDLPWD
ncbi:MAG: hypothetical protein IKL66_00855 [Clostridia bacterium]|nr:hypothetical protein [Clostridia bacterium]